MQHNTSEISTPLPIPPVYDLKLCSKLIPWGYRALVQYLYAHKLDFPAIYRRGSHGRRIRVLTLHDIRRLRAKALYGPGAARLITQGEKS